MTELRLVPTDPPPVEEDDPDDGTLGGLFAAIHAELSREPLTPAILGAVLLHVGCLAYEYAGVALPDPAERN